MEKYKIEYNNHSIKDFIEVWYIQRKYYKHSLIVPPIQDMEIDKKNNDTHIFIRDISTNMIIAELVLIPLNKKQFDDFMENKLSDLDLTSENIEAYKPNNSYFLLLCSIEIDINYRQDKNVLLLLLQGFYNRITELKNRGISFINMCAEAQTQDGIKFLEGFIKLNNKATTKDGFKLFCFDRPKEFNEWVKIFPNYIEEYKKSIY